MSKLLSKNVIYYGRDEPLPQSVALHAGPVSLCFVDGDLRYLRLGDREIIRRIYAAVRDRNWGTIPARVTKLDLLDHRDSFRIFYNAEHQQGDIHFTWRAEIVGEPSGRIVFTMDGMARKTFLKNRIGFCVLHPIRECAAAVCRVHRTDGTIETMQFPRLVAAEQPLRGFSDVATLAHEDAPGRWIELKFSGDVFEVEDQRNWIDASYKTYSTPLRLPFPVEMRAGQRLLQQISLEITGAAIVRAPDEKKVIEIDVNTAAAAPLPRLGLGVSSLGQPLSELARERLSRLNLAHLRADLRLASPDWKQEFARAVGEANTLNVMLELALFLPNDLSVLWPELRSYLRQARRGIARFMVFADGEKTTNARALGLARQHLADFRAAMGAGTNADFHQLNQSRPPHTAADFVTWSMNPQVHAFDLASLAETPEAIRAQLDSARQYFSGKPIVVSPITLKPRFNPVATGPEPPVPQGELPPQVDARQMSLFGAGWTLAAYKHLAEGGAQSVTFYETAGWRGIIETDQGSPVPQKFPSVPGGVFPMYHLFADFAKFAGGESLASVSSQPLSVNALVLRSGGRVGVLMANLTETKQPVKLSGFTLPNRMRLLDANTADLAMRDPEAFRERWTDCTEEEVKLPPFAYCVLEGDEH